MEDNFQTKTLSLKKASKMQ